MDPLNQMRAEMNELDPNAPRDHPPQPYSPPPLNQAPPPIRQHPTGNSRLPGWLTAVGVFAVAITFFGWLVNSTSSSNSGGNGTLTSSATAGSTVASTPVAAREPGDLGLSTPIENVGCTGGFVMIVSSTINSATYSSDIQAALSEYPGSKYLLTSQSCGSFTQQADDGSAIYAIYYGAFASLSEAMSYCSSSPNDAYARRLSTDKEVTECNP